MLGRLVCGGDGDGSWEGGMSSASGEYVGDQSSLLSLQPWVFRKESCMHDDESIGINGEFSGRLDGSVDGDQADQFSPRSIRVGCGTGRVRSSLRSRRARRYSVQTIGSNAGNCLVPQLYDQQFEIEEYVFSSPCVVTGGKRIISKSSYGPVHVDDGLENEVRGDALGAMGVPYLPVRTPKRKSRDARCEGLDTSGSRRYCNLSHSQGSPDRMLLFSLGVSIGVISTILSKSREVEKLNNSLKHTENLVRDLQDELDMKESLTMKELVNEACQSQELTGSYANLKEATDSFNNQVIVSYDHTERSDRCDQPNLLKAVEKSDSMSKIEAELEAELERLGLNMNSLCLDGEVSAFNEFDSDLIGDVVRGELRANMFGSGVQECQADPDRNSRGTSTADTYDPNYAVSPRELSLRLHELIQRRLEERIKELETELQHSQKQLQFVQTEGVISQGSFSNSDVESTSHESPIVMERDSASAQPLCLNLSGNALNAYKEFMRMTDTEDTLPSTTDTKKNLYGNGIYSTNRGLIWGMEGDDINKPSTDVAYVEGKPTWKQILSSSKGFDDVDECNGGDEYEIDDEEGKMIQQIVERTRQGSPVVLNAQRLFFSMNE